MLAGDFIERSVCPAREPKGKESDFPISPISSLFIAENKI